MTKKPENSRLMDLAAARRDSRAIADDSVLSIAVTVLDLEDSIEELYEQIQKETVYASDDKGKPRAVCFKHPIQVEDLERQIASMKGTMEQLQGILAHIERTFKRHGVIAKGVYSLDEDLLALQVEPEEIARKITRRVREMITKEPTIPLAMVWADEEIQTLEMKKAQAAAMNVSEIANIKKLKDALLEDTDEGRRIVEAVRHPGRLPLTPSMVEQAESPVLGAEVL
jgi:hypothetical protein